MISDVLFEAFEQIEQCQREYPQCYDDIRAEIDAVKAAMNQLRANLDNPNWEAEPKPVVVSLESAP